MDRVAAQQLTAADALEIPEADIGMIAVLEGDGLTWRDGPVLLLPDQDVHERPVEAARDRAVVRDLPLAVAVCVDDLGPHREPVGRPLALLELRVGHPSRRPAGAA